MPIDFISTKTSKDRELWYLLLLLLGFTAFFHVAVAVVLGNADLPMCYIPHGELKLFGVLIAVCVILGPAGLLSFRLVNDMVLQLRGGKPQAMS